MADVESDEVNGKSEVSETKIEVEKNKEETTSELETTPELETQIIEQVEYYFGDNNLPRDKFLQLEIKKDEGWVPLKVLLTFKRLLKLSKDASVIAAALKKSHTGLLEVSEDNTKIRRNPSHSLPEMNEARRQELVNRSVYVKGFPIENVEMDTLLDFFRKHTKVNQIIMRKYLDKATKTWTFKGSVFAVFGSLEEAAAFLKLAPLKYEDTELIMKWQKDYYSDKKTERLQLKLESQKHKRKHKGDRDNEEDKDEEEEKKKDELPKSASLYISECPDDLSRDELRAKIEDFGIGVAFLYFNKGDTEGWIRLQEPDSALQVVKDLKDGKLVINENVNVSVRALEGEEETKFLEKAKEDMAKLRFRNKGFKGKRGRRGGRSGGGGGGGGHFRKRRASPNRDEGVPAKKIAIEAE